MTQSQPVTRVVQILTEAGYRTCQAPLTVASVPFDFAALLIGSNRALDLVVVVDILTEQPEPRIRQKVEGLSRALDLVASRRPLTVVLVGPPPRAATLEALTKVSRVLTVGTPIGDGASELIKTSLAVLLPLQLPDATEIAMDPLATVRSETANVPEIEILSPLFDSALSGPEAVKQALRGIICEPLNRAREEDAS